MVNPSLVGIEGQLPGRDPLLGERLGETPAAVRLHSPAGALVARTARLDQAEQERNLVLDLCHPFGCHRAPPQPFILLMQPRHVTSRWSGNSSADRVVQRRMKRSGMRWSAPSARGVLARLRWRRPLAA